MISKINSYLKNEISKNLQLKNRKLIYDILLNNSFNIKNFDLIKSINVEQTFKLFDKIYFNFEIEKYIKENKIKISFMTSEKLIKTAGKICYDKDYKTFKFVISSTIIGNLFYDNNDKKKIGGLICNDRLECFILLFEHEFIHLILGITQLSSNETSHGPLFRKLIKNLFGQTEFSHKLLLKGDVLEIEKQTKCLKNDLKIGDMIVTKQLGNIILKGRIIKINPKKVIIKLENGKMYNVNYEFIDKVI